VFALSARATRRKRFAIVGSLAFLSLLVVAAGVGLYMIRSAEQQATAQAHRAEQQLVRTQAAEKAVSAEHAKTITANQKLETNNAQLRDAIAAANRARQEAETARTQAEAAQTAAEEARLKAEKSKHREARSRRKATAAAKEAQEAEAQAKAAEAQAEAAGKQLEAMLEKERKRVQELEEQTRGVKIIPDVPLR